MTVFSFVNTAINVDFCFTLYLLWISHDKHPVVNCLSISVLLYVINVIDVCDFIKVVSVFKNAKCTYMYWVQNVMVDIFWSFLFNIYSQYFLLMRSFLNRVWWDKSHSGDIIFWFIQGQHSVFNFPESLLCMFVLSIMTLIPSIL